MANVKLTQQDIDYIARVVETEVPRSIARRNPSEYDRMVRGVVDTVTNRMSSGVFPSSATGVLNQKRQFSKITGPARLDPYGSVQKTPRASAATKNLVTDYIAGRAAGEPTTIGGSLNYANPNYSSKSNLTGWINPMIERGAKMIGVGKNVHWYGTAPNLQPVGDYRLSAEGMPGGYVPRPSSPDDLPQSAQAGGILNAVNPPVPGLVQREEASPSGLLSAYQPANQPTEAQVSLDTLRQPQRPMSVADQYASYGAGKVATQQAGLLSQDVAHQRMIDQLNAQKQQMQAGINPMANQEPWKTPGLIAEQQPATTPVDVPEVSPQQTASVAAPSGGLLSPREQQMVDRQRAFLSRQPVNSSFGMKAGNFAKGALGGVGGGLLGAALLGPAGGLLGAALGNSLMNGRLNTMVTGYPKAPERAGSTGKTGRISKSQLNENGRNAYNSSQQFRDAVDRGSVGLY
jgi:cell wall hydrolase